MAFLLFLTARLALAGNVFIYVSHDKSLSCAPEAAGEQTIYRLDVDETTQALRNYFGGRKARRNPDLYDAAIVNAGLKFCGDGERQAVFNFLLHALDTPKPSRRVYEVIGNYGTSKIMEEELARELARPGISRAYRVHLGTAKKKITRK